ncbi:MAG: HAD family hydrolase [Candidatus Heimdallarchaeaceae archaeon]
MKSFRTVNTLLFDMDGTLTDLGKRWWEPFFRAFEKLKPNYNEEKKKEVFEQVLKSVVTTTQGSSKLLKIALFIKAIRALDLSIIDVFKAIKLLKTDPLAFKEIVPLEGVEEILNLLHSRGYRLALVTNAGDKTVERAKRRIEFFDKFDFIATRNKVKKIKPYPESLLLTCKQLGKKPHECVMIGDFPQDVEAGKAAGMKTVAILGKHGDYTKERLTKLQPDLLVSSINELTTIFPPIKY